MYDHGLWNLTTHKTNPLFLFFHSICYVHKIGKGNGTVFVVDLGAISSWARDHLIFTKNSSPLTDTLVISYKYLERSGQS
jgi:hypothetical protein